MKILVVEDEQAFAHSIKQYFEAEAHVCEMAHTFDDAADKLDLFEYDCILIDITLPGGTGLDLVGQIKQSDSNAGIIIISAKNAVDDRIKGLDLGADDYIPKPFHLSELNARVKALVRRRQFNGTPIIQFNEIEVDPHLQNVRVSETEIKLTKSEYNLLMYFLANKNRTISRESIAEHLLGDHADVMDSFDFIYSHIKNLRRKLIQAGSEDYIQAVYGVGYKLEQ